MRPIETTAGLTKRGVKYIDSLAVHEAAHLILYLLYCYKNNQLPEVNDIFLNSKHGRVSRRPNLHPGQTKAILECDIPTEAIAGYLRSCENEIKIYLAGIAGEHIHMGYENEERVLTYLYKKDKKDPNSDLSKAVNLNIEMGRQKYEDGALPLITLFKLAIKDVSIFWDEVMKIAELLDSRKRIEGIKLGFLVDELTSQIKAKCLELNIPTYYIS